MRQTGILAAAGILALTEMTRRLEEDHENARRLAKLLTELPGVSVDLESVQINMVFASFDWPDLSALQPWLQERGVMIGGCIGKELRFVTHHDVDAAAVERLVMLLREFRER